MKRLNNNGFAVTTLLYGILILAFLSVFSIMAYMSANRTNTKNLTNNIKEELSGFGRKKAKFGVVDTRKEKNYKDIYYTEGIPYYAPSDGYYFVQLFGAQGGSIENGPAGGKGAYTSGIIYLNSGTELYFYVGSQGETKSKNCLPGIGGGGYIAKCNERTSSGGGATYIKHNNNVIMVAAGGGGATSTNPGGYGGNLKGENGSGSSQAIGGGQTSSNELADERKFPGSLEGGSAPTVVGASAGGSGYYGGEAGKEAGDSGAGGSSYISGYAGVGDINNTYQLHFINGEMVPNVKVGDGYATITLIESFEPTYSSNITSIHNCCLPSDDNNVKKIEAINKDGKNIIKENEKSCQLFFDDSELSEIAIWYESKVNSTPAISVNWNKLQAIDYNAKVEENSIRYSLLDKITDGSYYIVSSSGQFYNKAENKFTDFSIQSNHIINLTKNNNELTIDQDHIIKTMSSYYYYLSNGKTSVFYTNPNEKEFYNKFIDVSEKVSEDQVSTATEIWVTTDSSYQLKLIRVYGE